MPFGIQVELLCDRYTASAYNDRDAIEWPPHWARLFYAVVDAWGSAEESSASERAAIEWLEAQSDPEIIAATDIAKRGAVTHFVPVNDVDLVERAAYAKRYDRLGTALSATSPDPLTVADQRDVVALVAASGSHKKTEIAAAAELFPDQRKKQGRTYPTVRPAHPTVTYWWRHSSPSRHRLGLDELLARVVRLGHSSTLVSVTLVDEQPTGGDWWQPDENGGLGLRSVRPGLLDLLERDHRQHQASRPRTMRAVSVRYRPPSQPEPSAGDDLPQANTAGPWRVLELVDPDDPAQPNDVPARLAAQLTEALRGAVLSHAPDGRAPLLSGHDPSGAPLQHPHASYLALPNVGHDRSTGLIHGLAVMIPTGTPEDEIVNLDAALAAWPGTLGRQGRWHVGPSQAGLATLNPRRWDGPATRWVTATPIALGRHPGDLRAHDSDTSTTARRRAAAFDAAISDIQRACGHIGLPDPTDIEVSLAPLLDGATPVLDYPAFKRGRTRRTLVHAAIAFPQPIRGPIVLGSGRYLGLGLCFPINNEARPDGS